MNWTRIVHPYDDSWLTRRREVGQTWFSFTIFATSRENRLKRLWIVVLWSLVSGLWSLISVEAKPRLTHLGGCEYIHLSFLYHHGPTTEQVYQTQTPGCLSEAQESEGQARDEEEVVVRLQRGTYGRGPALSGPFCFLRDCLQRAADLFA